MTTEDRIEVRPHPPEQRGTRERDATDRDLELLRRYEPVVRFTRGELFLPMAIDDYLASAALLRRTGKESEELVPRGELDPGVLAEFGRKALGAPLYLRYVAQPLDRRAYRQWRQRPDRVHFSGSSGAVVVHLLARLVAAALRLSLLLRGSVPGGWAAAAERQATASGQGHGHPYYGHVTRDGGWLVLQYWFFYAMNDWRSTFGGVNDHEADWEQVTVFAAEHSDGSTSPVWVAYSSHDEVGSDLRRRWDDPDLERVGEHPVVYAGAGSHSGVYVKGEYLVTVSPGLPGWLAQLRAAVRRVRLPGGRSGGGEAGGAVGIPYIDYHRGDGPSLGPGQDAEWRAVRIDDTTPWVKDYRGLWGLDTRDRLGGERGPAGPRYERDQRLRDSWSAPVAWAALDSEAPTAQAAAALLADREGNLHQELARVDADLDRARDALRAARTADAVAGREPVSPSPDVTALSGTVGELRERQARLRVQLEALADARHAGPPAEAVHAHLHRRALPLDRAPVRWSRLAQLWASASASLLLAALGVLLLRGSGSLLLPAACIVTAMLIIDALLRGRLRRLLLGVGGTAVVVVASWSLVALAIRNLRAGVGVLLLLAAVYVAGQTALDALRRR